MKKFMILFLCLDFASAFADTSLIIKYKPSARDTNLLSSKSISSKQLNAELMQPLSHGKVDKINFLLKQLDGVADSIKVVSDKGLAVGAHQLIINKDLNPKQQQQLLDLINKKIPNLDYAEFDTVVYPD